MQLGYTTVSNSMPSLQCGPSSFDTSDATKVGKMATFGYYTLVGPKDSGNYGSPFIWGYLQGFEAGWCYYQGRSFINGINIFADVETGNLGWYYKGRGGQPSNWGTQNVEVIQGFLDAVSASQGVSPGLYMGLHAYDKLTPGAQWKNLHDGRLPFVWWATSPANCGGLVEPSSIQSAGWYESEFNKWQQLNQRGSCTNGGDKISLWQYCAACSVNGSTQYDFDITTQAVTSGGTKGNMVSNWTIDVTNPDSFNSVSFKVTGDDWNTSWSSGSPPDPCYLWKLICISG
ncbi:MAG: hypothetical protein M1399_02665 [Actinobacteria bacterium]|nr:hypothetical protein [Actinomycetota bacterium]